jgi:hypothetical protein
MVPVRDESGNIIEELRTVRVPNELTRKGANRSIRVFAANGDSDGHSGNVRSSTAQNANGEDFDVTETIRGLFASAARYGQFEQDPAYTVSVREESGLCAGILRGSSKFRPIVQKILDNEEDFDTLTDTGRNYGAWSASVRKYLNANRNPTKKGFTYQKPTERTPVIDLTITYRERNPNMPKAKKVTAA